MTVFTIGYGGRLPAELIGLLAQHGVRAVVDVRLRPDRASMGVWVKARSPDRGIEHALGQAGIEYHALLELGNLFLEFPDWQQRYAALLRAAGPLLIERLADVPQPYCLLCAERRAAECHRSQIADYLASTQGASVVHLE